MTHAAPILASETRAAHLLDMKVAGKRSLVTAGHLPRGREIGGMRRWDMPELYRIFRGEAIEAMGDVNW